MTNIFIFDLEHNFDGEIFLSFYFEMTCVFSAITFIVQWEFMTRFTYFFYLETVTVAIAVEGKEY